MLHRAHHPLRFVLSGAFALFVYASLHADSPAKRGRVVLITSADNTHSKAEVARLNLPYGEFAKLRSAGWKIGSGPENHLQIVDRGQMTELVEKLSVKEFPLVAYIEGEEIVRSFKSGCTTPLDAWTFGFLAKGVDERPPGMIMEAARVETTGHYPLRGNHWSVDDDWNPTRDRVVSHLRGPVHGPQIRVGWEIETWSYEELRSLHDNLHEQEMGGVSFGSRSAPTSRNSPPSAGGKITGR